ncbi:hypothetical protein O4215_20700 [Rhodococcus maanshanensis]|uniref:hypothetical protein n=1 Tax=Rhodococcus maanshanensis TaxID=183556 RepID=UPI0022B531BD|nr:hypothetical protein [Rhodococcus maanshanensis]MCZ4557985.1 hypothetical protein [Rhodococcus maanshanensis]
MTSIIAPAGVVSTGISYHVLTFVDGACPDPGLNAGERAHLLGGGYKFADGGESTSTATPDVESVADAVAPAAAKAKTKAKAASKPKGDEPAPAAAPAAEPATPADPPAEAPTEAAEAATAE